MDSAKIQWILQKVRANPTEKFVVFSHFLDAGINNVIQGLGDIGHGVIRGDVPMATRKRLVDDFNTGVFNVLFISKAGGEGLDLKGVRNVIIMEPAWNDATEEQVIGRAIRYKSHEGLPPSQQSVTVWSLYHIRPTDDPKKLENYLTNLRKRGNAEEERIPFSPTLESFDLFMRGLIIRKQYKINRYNKQLGQLSIEKNTCTRVRV
jgi:superfamily II DNA/RNA helicase